MSSWQRIQAAMSSEHLAFIAALKKPLEAQFDELQSIVESNRDCAYGQQYNFASIKTVEDYQQQVPVTTYEQLAPMIERMAAGEPGLLCQAPVSCFEKTGGSSGGARLIPYTERSLLAMRRALYPWLMDLTLNRPGITRGNCYWSISPAMREQSFTPGGVPVGMPNDALYFGAGVATQLELLLAAPTTLAQSRNLDSWRYLTLRYLLSNRDLTLVSVWSPSFLLDLLQYLDAHHRRFADDIETGSISIDRADLPLNDQTEFGADLHLADLLRASVRNGEVDTARLWPQLDTLSCWTDGSAGLFVSQLQARFPGVHLQGKGLLATEGFISLPLSAAGKSVLALRSGFYEFEDESGRIHLCDDLEQGKCYEIILSNHAGLYRYRLGDRVICVGYHENTPLIKFVGRGRLVSDICGEKLSEDFVLQQLDSTRGFTTLLPALEPQRGYCLIVDALQWSVSEADEYAMRVDLGLQKNPQYQYARSLGQLAALSVLRVESPWQHYSNYCHQRNRQQGDLKPPALCIDSALLDFFNSEGSIRTEICA